MHIKLELSEICIFCFAKFNKTFEIKRKAGGEL